MIEFLRTNRTLAATLLLAAACLHGASAFAAQPDGGLLFAMDGSTGTEAQQAGGAARPLFNRGVRAASDGAVGPALDLDGDLTLAWAAPGNMLAQRGTISFFIRSTDPFDKAPVTLFRVGTADSTSWDFTFLRVDWNGHGYDAFVTDANLGRTRVSWVSPDAPDGSDWVHVAFAWDEETGAELWIDGKRVGAAKSTGVFDQSLFAFGPFQRVISPQKTESAYNGVRPGQLDELRIYDHALSDGEVAKLAAGEAVSSTAAAPRSLNDKGVSADWDARFGWSGVSALDIPARSGALAIRKVEFTDTRDEKTKAFRGADGIRETTWPGVYNRSRLTGRTDYFVLPDWNTYSTAGRRYDLTLPDKAWNRVEIQGAAHGRLLWQDKPVLTRRAGIERSSDALNTRTGGVLSFVNDLPETPIQEIGVYHVHAVEALPESWRQLDYTVDIAASPGAYRGLDTLTAALAGRRPRDERAAVVALPSGGPLVEGASGAIPAPDEKTLPVVTVMIPATFRDQAHGGIATRFDQGWKNMNAGLDGVALTLPAMGTAKSMALNIRLHDPLWPARDLVDINVRIDPRHANTIWLDSRDRILRDGDPISLTIASADPDFGAASLQGAEISLRFKPADAARAEHVADRLEQARDQLASTIEEKPASRLYPSYVRFERDVSDVLRVDPDNARALALWHEVNPDQAAQAVPPPPPVPDGVPAWAFRQTEALKTYREFVDWWIDHRQMPSGEFGGGLSDDTDLVNQWVGLALMGVERERIAASQRAVLDATIANGMWDNGINRIVTDQLHTYEEGINTLAQAMMLTPGDPALIAMAQAAVAQYPRIIRKNPAGHDHFASAWYSGSEIYTGGHLGRQYPYSFLITHPGLLLGEYEGDEAARRSILAALDSWLAHAEKGDNGVWRIPSEIAWESDSGSGNGVGPAIHDFWAAWLWTGDDRYLRAIAPAGMTAGSAANLFSLNADALAWLPGGDALARKIADGALSDPGARFDPNLGTASNADRARFVTWQMDGENDLLANLYAGETARTRARWYVLTDAELWSDRVAVPSEFLQRARLGGVAHLRNAYFPGNLVEWRFADPHGAEDMGIMIPRGNRTQFRVIAHNLSDRPIEAEMLGAMLTGGQWTMTSGRDADGDNRADRQENAAKVTLARGQGVTLLFPPHRTMVFDFALAMPEVARP